ncbi:MAG: hypothetical protein LIP03_08705 [Bacteroidales bacterium]|nr:hypothetical protein [Bacteroidales bacterium]
MLWRIVIFVTVLGYCGWVSAQWKMCRARILGERQWPHMISRSVWCGSIALGVFTVGCWRHFGYDTLLKAFGPMVALGFLMLVARIAIPAILRLKVPD